MACSCAAAASLSSRREPSTSTGWSRPALACLTLVGLLGFVDGHTRAVDPEMRRIVFWTTELPTVTSSGRVQPMNDLYALGRFVSRSRQERGDGGVPVRVQWPNPRNAAWAVLAHAAGDPGGLEPASRAHVLDGLSPGQLVIGQHRLHRPFLVPVGEIGRYRIYRVRGRQVGAEGPAR